MSGQDDDAAYAHEQAIRLARIRARIREGVWALRENSALQGHWEALERDGAGSKRNAETPGNATLFKPLTD